MTDTTTDELARHPEQLPMLPGELRPHPTPRQYVLIAVILVMITGVEIAVSYTDGSVNTNLIIVVLLVLAFVKFFLVAAWFMHLRTDKPMFSRIFTGAIIAAAVLYAVVLASLYGFASLHG
jgi:cytochrome c oxidase subunit 4